MSILTVIILGAICGLIGSFAMNLFMRTVSHAYSQRVDMVIALGSFFYRHGRSRGNTWHAYSQYRWYCIWDFVFPPNERDELIKLSVCDLSGPRIRILSRTHHELLPDVHRQRAATRLRLIVKPP